MGNHGPREASYTKLQADFTPNQDFLGFWTVDIYRESHNQRSAPRRDTQHTSEGVPFVHLKNRVAGVGKVISRSSPSTWSPEPLRPGKGTKCRPNEVCTFVEYLRT